MSQRTLSENIEICRQFYIATGLPIVLLKGTETVYSSIGEYLDFFPALPVPVQPQEKNPEFCETVSDIPYGRIRIEGTEDFAIVGPVFPFTVDEGILRTYMREYRIPSEYRETLNEYLGALPILTQFQFANYLLMLHTLLNGKVMGMQDFLDLQGDGPEPLQNDRKAAEKAIGKRGESTEEHLMHLSMRRERLRQLVRLGNEKALSEYLSRHPRMFEAPKMAGSALRQAKDEFIALTAEITETCLVPAGVPLSRIRSMQSTYIQKCEELQSVEIIHWLRRGMLLDFCRQAGQGGLPENVSHELLLCLQYIRENIGSPIRNEDIAGSIGRSVSYVRKLFLRELRMTPGAFVSARRIELAKELLGSVDEPLSRIAFLLGYSSQAHFQTVFKKETGLTPGAYRASL